MTYTGRFYVYFNRHQAKPHVWSVMALNPDGKELWELNLECVELYGAARTVYSNSAESDDETGIASARVFIIGTLTVSGNTAVIKG